MIATKDPRDYDRDPANLHPDLRDWVVEKSIGLMVQHPLVNTVLYDTDSINQMYEAKRKWFTELRAKHEIHAALHACIERPFRLELLVGWRQEGHITNAEFVRELPGIWSDAEPDDTLAKHRSMWQLARRLAGQIVTCPDEAAEAPIPFLNDHTVTLFRGVEQASGEKGIAWTTDESIAEFFATRFRSGGYVARAEADVANVLGWVQCRGESEVIVNPRKVRIIDRRRLA